MAKYSAILSLVAVLASSAYAQSGCNTTVVVTISGGSTATNCTTCNSGYYASINTGNNVYSCVPCGVNCQKCTTNTQCTTCNSGYFANNGACGSCPSNCTTCSNSTSCTNCNGTYLVMNYTNGTSGCVDAGAVLAGLAAGVIVAIVLGGLCCLCLLGLCLYCCLKGAGTSTSGNVYQPTPNAYTQPYQPPQAYGATTGGYNAGAQGGYNMGTYQGGYANLDAQAPGTTSYGYR